MKVKIDPKQLTQNFPEDDYEGTVVKLFKSTSAAGNRSGGFQIRISEGDYAGRKVIGNITVTEDSLWKANQLHKAVTDEDLPEQEFETEDDFLDFLFEAVNGHSLSFRVKHRLDNQGSERMDLTYLSR